MVRGYSYIQMLLVIALLALLAAVASPYYLAWQQRQSLRSTSSILLSDLRYVQSKAMQREQDASWGIYIDDSSKHYTLFHGASYSASDAYNQTVSYPASVSISASPTNEIALAGLTGAVASEITITMTSVSLPTASKTIHINAEGLVTPY
ncbi:MAG: hypothetical protein HY565_01610 [Candidatus Kerfeldbacteria bacterium]|nr:hypothetical protein [Candidatus Kerfeldbacteria bacterium]